MFLKGGRINGVYTPPVTPNNSFYKDPNLNRVFVTFVGERGTGHCGELLEAVVEVKCNGEKSLIIDGTAKLAYEENEQRNLLNEYHTYEAIRAAGIPGVPACVGIFHDAEEGEEGPTCLIISDEGAPLSAPEEAVNLEEDMK
jgi:hypothetical protein